MIGQIDVRIFAMDKIRVTLLQDQRAEERSEVVGISDVG